MRRTSYFVAAVLLPLAAFAGSAALADDNAHETLFGEANRAASVGRHEAAADRLEALIAAEGFSPNVLLNLGNAHYRSGRLGHAVLAWERGLLLAPQDPGLQSNLADAREKARLSEPELSDLESAARLLPANDWLTIGAMALFVFCLGAAAYHLVRRGRLFFTPVTVIAALTVVASSGAIWLGTLSVDRAVVVAEDGAVARISPFDDADAVYKAPEGELVTVKERHGAWFRVEDHTHRTGWLPRSAIERLVTETLPRELPNDGRTEG